MTIPVVNLRQALAGVEQPWTPLIVGEVNDYDLKVARVEGAFREHAHADTDELFVVLSGSLTLTMPEQTVILGPMDAATVPRGTPHRPEAEPGTTILMLEPRGTTQDGTPSGNRGTRVLP